MNVNEKNDSYDRKEIKTAKKFEAAMDKIATAISPKRPPRPTKKRTHSMDREIRGIKKAVAGLSTPLR